MNEQLVIERVASGFLAGVDVQEAHHALKTLEHAVQDLGMAEQDLRKAKEDADDDQAKEIEEIMSHLRQLKWEVGQQKGKVWTLMVTRKASQKFDGYSPEEYAGLWGSTKGQGAAHFYNYGSEHQIKDAQFYNEFMTGRGGIKDTIRMIEQSLAAKDGNFTRKDWDEMNRFAKYIADEARRVG